MSHARRVASSGGARNLPLEASDASREGLGIDIVI
jgi:hypothetical protein